MKTYRRPVSGLWWTRNPFYLWYMARELSSVFIVIYALLLLWGLLRHQWGTAHAWISVILLSVLAVHVALHWRWLVMGLSRRLGVAAWAARSPIPPARRASATATRPSTRCRTSCRSACAAS